MTIHDEFSGTLTLTENSSRELFRVLQEQDEAFISDVLDGKCGFTLKSADGRSVELVPKADRKIENSSEIPNNCEHITEDGVTCAKYPACDDCLDNPLNKLKGSERLVKGSEQTDCQTCKWWSSYGYCVHRECKGYAPQTEREGE